jgi:hypothetical protein
MRFKFFLFALVFLPSPTLSLSQTGILQGKEGIYAIVEDFWGERLEGYLRSYPEELTVSTKDNQEKSVPLKYIESIKLEKVHGALPGTEQMGGEAYYSVRLQNSQEILTLRHKYTFSLTTGIGLVTRPSTLIWFRVSFKKVPLLPLIPRATSLSYEIRAWSSVWSLNSDGVNLLGDARLLHTKQAVIPPVLFCGFRPL